MAPQRAGRHRGARSNSAQPEDSFLKARLRPLLSNSSCARSHEVCADDSQPFAARLQARCALQQLLGECCHGRLGDARAWRPAGWAGSSASDAAARGTTSTPWRPVHTSCPSSSSPNANSSGSPSGANSGTTRETGRPAASRACSVARRRARSHTATHAGCSAAAPGSMAKCRSSSSSSSRSSSRPSSTARSRGERGPVPLGSSTRCHDRAAAGTITTVSLPAPDGAGNSAAAAVAWAETLRPSGDSRYSNSVDAEAGDRGRRTNSELM